MSFDPLIRLTSKTLVLPQDNIDTDQIIPARFLTTTSSSGLGDSAFYDWRYEEDGSLKKDSPLNAPDAREKKILVAGANFACGSSREHAPWALKGFGFQAVISSDIADIFKSNALKNGVLPLEIDRKAHQFLLENPDIEITIDLEHQTLHLQGNWTVKFAIDAFSRRCLLDGVDPMGHILNQIDAIKTYEAQTR